MNPMIYISVVRSRSDYYPFGTRTGTYAEAADADGRWRFSGKEWQAEPAGLPLLDFGARLYDPATAVWLSQDPMAEKYPSLSPYSYCAGDPIGLIDVRGDSLLVVNQSMVLALNNGVRDPNIRIETDNKGMIIPTLSMSQSSDWFVQDIYSLASSQYKILLNVGYGHNYMDQKGRICYSEFGIVSEFDDTPFYMKNSDGSYIGGSPLGYHIQGNLGVSLMPSNDSFKRSLDDNINVIINENTTLNQKTVGIAHEFSHVLLFVMGLPFRHGDSNADIYIENRSKYMSRRLGYDN